MQAPHLRLPDPLHRPAIGFHANLVVSAAALDRLADAELQHGHRLAAERLAQRAAAMREAAA